MDLNEIQRLAGLVKDIDLHELEIVKGDMRVRIVNHKDYPEEQKLAIRNSDKATVSEISQTEMMGREAAHDQETPSDCHIIKSPIIGTFYSAPAPEAPAFVSVGTPVDISSTVCIIEAMKVMNEIQAEVKGTIIEILVENGQPVEFGQPLFKVKKS